MSANNDNLIEEVINDSLYDIRSDGTVWARKPKSGPSAKNKIYPLRRVDFLCDGKYYGIRYKNKYLKAHRVIYRKFIGNLNERLTINHKDGNKLNNNLSNLELITHKENCKHAGEIGLFNYFRKLSEQDVLDIRELSKQGIGPRELSRLFNVSHSVIINTRDKKYWKHI